MASPHARPREKHSARPSFFDSMPTCEHLCTITLINPHDILAAAPYACDKSNIDEMK